MVAETQTADRGILLALALMFTRRGRCQGATGRSAARVWRLLMLPVLRRSMLKRRVPTEHNCGHYSRRTRVALVCRHGTWVPVLFRLHRTLNCSANLNRV